uniref:Putative metalloproteinase n=1 Tax=Tityus obscurus TaxID=1221240 RepID=A0A1E1WVW3_TITOB
MIFYLASIVFFATVSAIPSGRVEVVFPSVETSRSGVKTIKFTALDQDVELKLTAAGEILGRDFIFQDATGKMIDSFDVDNLRRKIYRDSANGAALFIDEDGPLTIEGIINSNLRIEPYESGRIIKDGITAHQIVELVDDKISYFKDSIMPKDIRREAESVAGMAREGECIVVEYLILTESTFTQRFGSDEDLNKYIALMFTGVQNLMDTLEMGLKVVMIGHVSYTSETEPSFITENSFPSQKEVLNPEKVIDSMTEYFCNNKTELSERADIIMLISARKLGRVKPNGEVAADLAGLSNDGSVCKSCAKLGVCNDNSNYNERVDTVAHESAHILGSPHDGDGPEKFGVPGSPGSANCPESDGYIMGRRNKENGMKFSECTKECIKYLLSQPRASCVYENCPESI